MAEENIRKKNENKPKDEFGWDEAPVSIRDFGIPDRFLLLISDKI